MDQQSVKIAVWLGIAVLALVWANLSLWHAHRVLKQIEQDHCVTQIRLASAPVRESVRSGELTDSAIAS